MFNARVYTADGTENAERPLPGGLFDGVVHEQAMWQAVKAYLANRRAGTASTKNRSAVRGGSRKPWRQKGTGRARQGTIRAPQWRGGGVVFGPTANRNHHEAVPRKLKALARRSAYNARAEDGKVVLVEGIDLETPRTKQVIALLEAIGAEGNVLLLTDGLKPVVYLSARNIPRVAVRPFGEESAYDVLRADTVIIEASALASIPEESDAEAEAEAGSVEVEVQDA